MSLVVARRTAAGGVAMIADARVWSYARNSAVPPRESASKLFILRKDLVVGFAGILEPTIDEVTRTLPRPVTTPSAIAHITAASKLGGFVCLAASVEGDLSRCQARLHQIEGGKAEEVQGGGVGSPSAFARFQGLMLGSSCAKLDVNRMALTQAMNFNVTGGRPQTPEDHLHQEQFRMSAAMSEVVMSGEFPDVGDFVQKVTSTRHGFRYVTEIDLFADGPGKAVANEDIHAKTAAEGGFTPILLSGPAPSDPEGPIFPAIYFVQGKFGYLYHSTDLSIPRAVTVHAKSVREFASICASNHGVALGGVGYGPEGFFIL